MVCLSLISLTSPLHELPHMGAGNFSKSTLVILAIDLWTLSFSFLICLLALSYLKSDSFPINKTNEFGLISGTQYN